jgi:hypothetical protein
VKGRRLLVLVLLPLLLLLLLWHLQRGEGVRNAQVVFEAFGLGLHDRVLG